MEEASSKNNSEEYSMENYLEVKKKIDSMFNYFILLFNDKTQEIILKSSLLLEFYNLKEEIINLKEKNCPKDEIGKLNFINGQLLKTKLDIKFSKYSDLITVSENSKLLYDAEQFFSNPDMHFQIEFCNHIIINSVLNLKIYLLNENINLYISMGLKTNNKLITDVPKLIYFVINHLKIGLNKGKLLRPLDNLFVNNQFINTSKSTSDRYIIHKIDILNDVLDNLGHPRVNIRIGSDYSDDYRIDTGLPHFKILNYFMKLNTINPSNNKVVLSINEINTLVNSNFVSREFAPIERIFLDANINKAILKRFVYEFSLIDNNTFNGKLTLYKEFLIKNFNLFKDDTIDSLSAHFAIKRSKKYFL